MAEEIKLGSIKRFGARYGRKVKEKFAEIEALHRKKYKCPYCNQQKVKRIKAGIWECGKCKAKFTSKAFTVSKKIVLKEEVKKEGAEKERKKKGEKEEEPKEEREVKEE